MADTDDIVKYLDRLMNDEKFQERLAKSASSGKSAVRRAKRKKSAAKAAGDPRIRRQLLAALSSASEAVEALNRPKKKPKRRWIKRILVLGVLGSGVYLATNEAARSQLMQAVGLDSEESLNSAG